MLGEHDTRPRPPGTREGGVHKRRVVVSVHDGGLVFVNDSRDGLCQSRSKARAATKLDDGHATVLKFRRPGAAFVQTAHPHRDLVVEPFDQLHHETLSTAWMQAEDDLKDAKHDRDVRPAARYGTGNS